MTTRGVGTARCPPVSFVSILLDITTCLLYLFVCYLYLNFVFLLGGLSWWPGSAGGKSEGGLNRCRL
jgi:hypothetical protein